MYRYYQAAYERLIIDEHWNDNKYPKVPGNYVLLVFDKEQNKMKRVNRKWDGKKFELEVTDNLTVMAWHN